MSSPVVPGEVSRVPRLEPPHVRCRVHRPCDVIHPHHTHRLPNNKPLTPSSHTCDTLHNVQHSTFRTRCWRVESTGLCHKVMRGNDAHVCCRNLLSLPSPVHCLPSPRQGMEDLRGRTARWPWRPHGTCTCLGSTCRTAVSPCQRRLLELQPVQSAKTQLLAVWFPSTDNNTCFLHIFSHSIGKTEESLDVAWFTSPCQSSSLTLATTSPSLLHPCSSTVQLLSLISSHLSLMSTNLQSLPVPLSASYPGCGGLVIEQPSHVGVPEALVRGVGVLRRIAMLMMVPVGGHPL